MSVSSVSKFVIEDVIKSLRAEGLEDDVLAELQKLWEAKLQANVATTSAPLGGLAPMPSLTEDYSNYHPQQVGPYDIANMPPFAYSAEAGGAMGMPQELLYQHQQNMYAATRPIVHQEVEHIGRPQQFMAPAGWTAPPLNIVQSARPQIPQYDGKDDGMSRIKQEGDEEGELGSDLDDSDDEEPQTENLVLCQFEKVTRIKNKRKCILKAGVMHLNGRDYLFNKANGEFEW